MHLNWAAAVGLLLVLGSVGAVVDLTQVRAHSLTVYTTPAIRDVLERLVVPRWYEQGGMRVALVYSAAGEEYNRLRMSGASPEADVFVHASPLFLQKGIDEGYFLPFNATIPFELDPSFRGGNGSMPGWYTFTWSPLVEVYPPALGSPPDLLTTDRRFGFPHPTLSNNGVYTALFFEEVSRPAGRNALSRTVVQPVNARANILGVADGSFDVTLGYEAVTQFFQDKGAKVAYEFASIGGERVTTPVMFTVAIVQGGREETATEFASLLFANETQAQLAQFHFRSVSEAPRDSLQGTRLVEIDWSKWATWEQVLPRYEVGSAYG